MENKLQGLTVLVTRPRQQSAELIAAIAQQGGRVCQLPLIQIERLQTPEELQLIKNHILNLDRYDHAIFISSNAASIGLDWIERYWPQIPANLSALAVGAGTAAILKNLPWQVTFPETGSTSEDLLELPQMKAVHGKRIALFRGSGGRELLAETLRERGATVDYVELYRRGTPDYSKLSIDALIRSAGVNAVVVTSSQILEVLLHLSEENSLIRALPVCVPSERVGAQARDAGFRSIFNAGGASEEAIIKALLQLYARQDEEQNHG